MLTGEQVWKDLELQNALNRRGSGRPIKDAVKTALDGGADPNMIVDSSFATPLSLAVKWSEVEAVEYLLAAGANPDYLYEPGSQRYGVSPRMVANGMARDAAKYPHMKRGAEALAVAKLFERF